MVKSTTIGTPSSANDTLGGVPNFYYYDFGSKGRGEVSQLTRATLYHQQTLTARLMLQVIRLFFEDAGVSFVDYRYSFDEYNGKTVEEREKIK